MKDKVETTQPEMRRFYNIACRPIALWSGEFFSYVNAYLAE